MHVNSYTLRCLVYQRERLEQLIKNAHFPDEVLFYIKCLNEVNKDIDIIDKKQVNLSKNDQNSDICE
jgi:hypothetical protein